MDAMQVTEIGKDLTVAEMRDNESRRKNTKIKYGCYRQASGRLAKEIHISKLIARHFTKELTTRGEVLDPRLYVRPDEARLELYYRP